VGVIEDVGAIEDVCRHEARRVSALRLQLLDLHPFWGFLLAHLKVLLAPELCAFAATDCHRHIWLNPMLTRHLDLPQLGFVLAHELGHHLLASADRQRGRQAQRWNTRTARASPSTAPRRATTPTSARWRSCSIRAGTA
jgi:predicted metal-dependent peptidase